MIAIIDYKAGNLASVANSLKRLNVEFVFTDQKKELEASRAVIFPGVGHAEPAMDSLKSNGLVRWLKNTSKPVLGICLGMQLFYESSEEGETKGLGVASGSLKKFDSSKGKVPHIGWNTFTSMEGHPIFNEIQKEHYFYYVHSYYAPVTNQSIATCHYIEEFTSVVEINNYLGVQFHPEKSGSPGAQLLKNFLEIIES